MKKTALLLFLFACLVACKNEGKKESQPTQNRELIPDHDANPVLSTAETIAYKNGFDTWNDVSELNFTFNVDRGERHFERSFKWMPQTNEVTYMSSNDTVSYQRSASLDSIYIQADQAFINDKYWLLAPFQLVWDEGTSISEKESQIAPISKDTLNMLTIVYGEEGGYTPGDAYDFYYGNDFMVKEWVFREGNQEAASMATTFEDYEDFSGLKIAQMHKDSTGGFKLYFTNISVKK